MDRAHAAERKVKHMQTSSRLEEEREGRKQPGVGRWNKRLKKERPGEK